MKRTKRTKSRTNDRSQVYLRPAYRSLLEQMAASEIRTLMDQLQVIVIEAAERRQLQVPTT